MCDDFFFFFCAGVTVCVGLVIIPSGHPKTWFWIPKKISALPWNIVCRSLVFRNLSDFRPPSVPSDLFVIIQKKFRTMANQQSKEVYFFW